MACGTVDPGAVVGSLLAVADCQARALGSDGWHGLAGSGLFAALLTGLLTLAVAREGYRLLAGGTGAVPEDAVRLLIRFGIVIALSTSWQAYDRVIHRVVMDGPAEVGAAVFPSAGIATDALGVRLQHAYEAILTAPEPPVDPAAMSTTGQGSASAEATPPRAEGGISRGSAALVMLVTGAGSWIAARFVLALLVAIGPLAIAAALFESAAGLFVGWLRALIGAALATLVIPLSLSLELQMLAGPVTFAVRAGLPDIPGLGMIVWSFALVNAALVMGVQRIAGGLSLPRLRPGAALIPAPVPDPAPPAQQDRSSSAPAQLSPPTTAAPSRALVIARAVEQRGRAIGGTALADRGGGGDRPARRTDGPQRMTPMVEAQRGTAAGRRALAGKRLDIR